MILSQYRVYTSIIEANLYTLFYMYIFADFRQPTEYTVDRVLSLFSSRLNWDSPLPVKLAGEGVGSPNSDEGRDTVVL